MSPLWQPYQGRYSLRGLMNNAKRGQQLHRHKQPYGYRIIQTAEVKARLELSETLAASRRGTG